MADRLNWVSRSERLPVCAAAIIQSADGFKSEANITNMSDSGCKVHTPKPFSIGDRVRITIERLGFLDAEVRWTSIGSAGLQFLGRELSR